jgi:hypothetical protein
MPAKTPCKMMIKRIIPDTVKISTKVVTILSIFVYPFYPALHHNKDAVSIDKFLRIVRDCARKMWPLRGS